MKINWQLGLDAPVRLEERTYALESVPAVLDRAQEALQVGTDPMVEEHLAHRAGALQRLRYMREAAQELAADAILFGGDTASTNSAVTFEELAADAFQRHNMAQLNEPPSLGPDFAGELAGRAITAQLLADILGE